MMTKKDYERAVDIVHEFRHPAGTRPWPEMVPEMVETAFVKLFQGDNPSFDTDRFLQAARGPLRTQARRSR